MNFCGMTSGGEQAHDSQPATHSTFVAALARDLCSFAMTWFATSACSMGFSCRRGLRKFSVGTSYRCQ
jgi:hypothetical protein